MTIEPHNVTTVALRPLGRMDGPRTDKDYRADLIRRFGEIPTGWALVEWLAQRENDARRGINPHSTMARPQTIGGNPRSPEAEQRRIEALRKSLNAKTEDARKRILAALDKPKTVGDLERETGIHRQRINGLLGDMAAHGIVSKTKVRRVAIWQRTQEAAE